MIAFTSFTTRSGAIGVACEWMLSSSKQLGRGLPRPALRSWLPASKETPLSLMPWMMACRASFASEVMPISTGKVQPTFLDLDVDLDDLLSHRVDGIR